MITNKDIKKYEHLVYSIVNRYRDNTFKYKTYIDWNEVSQIGLLALCKAIEGYDNSKGTFKNYAITAITRAILRYINNENNYYQSNFDIDTQYDIGYSSEDDIDISMMSEKILKIIDKFPINNNSKEMIRLRLQGYSYQAIGDKFGVTCQSVQQTVTKQIDRLARELKEV